MLLEKWKRATPVGDDIVVEVKFNLHKRDKFQRLI